MTISAINLAFKKTKQEKRPALLTYTVAGDNTKKKSLELLNSISKYVDICELGFPHNTPIGDGGQWNMATNLIRKHGLVPMSAYPESHSSSSTRSMNTVLKDILRTTASEIRGILDGGGSNNEARKHKEERMEKVKTELAEEEQTLF